MSIVQDAQIHQQMSWFLVPQHAVTLWRKCAASAQDVRQAVADLPRHGILDVWYNPDRDKLFLNVGDWIEQDNLDTWKKALEPLATDFEFDFEAGHPEDGSGKNTGEWVKVAARPRAAIRFGPEKRAYSRAARDAMEWLNFFPGAANQYLPGAPSPMASMLTTGLLGAGLGYGGGMLAEKALPEQWKRNRLRRSLALMGAVAGAFPGAVLSANALAAGRSPWESGPFNAPTDDIRNYLQFDAQGNPQTAQPLKSLHKLGADLPAADEAYKQAIFDSRTGIGGVDGLVDQKIDIEEFNTSLWGDRRVSQRLPVQTRAAASGLVTGASHLAGNGKKVRWITPGDVAKMTAGMGSGYLSGALVGKALGALTGMPHQTQDRLKNTGMWAGVIANMVPLAFRG